MKVPEDKGFLNQPTLQEKADELKQEKLKAKDNASVLEELEKQEKEVKHSNPDNRKDYLPKGYVRPKKRIPVSRRNNFNYRGLDDKYYYRMVNETKGGMPNLERYLDAGYEFVHDKYRFNLDDKEICGQVGTRVDTRIRRTVGHDQTAYLMRLPRDLYEEDQRQKSVERRRAREGLYGRQRAELGPQPPSVKEMDTSDVAFGEVNARDPENKGIY